MLKKYLNSDFFQFAIQNKHLLLTMDRINYDIIECPEDQFTYCKLCGVDNSTKCDTCKNFTFTDLCKEFGFQKMENMFIKKNVLEEKYKKIIKIIIKYSRKHKFTINYFYIGGFYGHKLKSEEEEDVIMFHIPWSLYYCNKCGISINNGKICCKQYLLTDYFKTVHDFEGEIALEKKKITVSCTDTIISLKHIPILKNNIFIDCTAAEFLEYVHFLETGVITGAVKKVMHLM